ncbi:SDR family NAD(P)-dependent oxidoreductase, partial [Novipirellula sp.]|uniref:SDR family NAD(P)-dependent oxidoreductase n=1 Tax=Novipirellula sp. TaxID=2795430 RepID=UPI0035621E19
MTTRNAGCQPANRKTVIATVQEVLPFSEQLRQRFKLERSMKTILLTGATDGIGLATAKMLISLGHLVLLHGRNREKLDQVIESLGSTYPDAKVNGFVADLSSMTEVESLAKSVLERYDRLDVLINNAGVFKVSDSMTAEKLDVRFVVN